MSEFDWTKGQDPTFLAAGVAINPGTGPVSGASLENARVNIAAFIADLDLDGITCDEHGPSDGDGTGRFAFTLRLGERESEIDMPGLSLERVRFTGAADQNIWDFPRLYENGSSWVWKFGLNCARTSLTGEDEDE